jgi:hypothetical protein
MSSENNGKGLRDVQTMIQIVRSDAVLDRTEAYSVDGKPGFNEYWFGVPDPRLISFGVQIKKLQEDITKKNEDLKKLASEVDAKQEKLKKLENNYKTLQGEKETCEGKVGVMSNYIESLEQQRKADGIQTSQCIEDLKKKLVEKGVDAIPSSRLYDKYGGHAAYAIQNFIIISPDKQGAYNIEMKKSIPICNGGTSSFAWFNAYGNSSNLHPTCQADIKFLGDCKSVKDLLELYYIDSTDVLLNFDWEEISNPDTAKVQSIIRVESVELRSKREAEALREKEENLQNQRSGKTFNLLHGN